MAIYQRDKDVVNRNNLRLLDEKKRVIIKIRCEEIYKIFSIEKADKNSMLYDFLNTYPYNKWAADIRSDIVAMTDMCYLFHTNERDVIPILQAGSRDAISGMPTQMYRLIALLQLTYCEIGITWDKRDEIVYDIGRITKELLFDLERKKITHEEHDNYRLYRKLYEYLYYSESEDGDRFVDTLKEISKILICWSWDFYNYTISVLLDFIDHLETLPRVDRFSCRPSFEKTLRTVEKVDIRTDKEKIDDLKESKRG